MKKNTILTIIAFLERANLMGKEVKAYNECIQELNNEFSKEENIEVSKSEE